MLNARGGDERGSARRRAVQPRNLSLGHLSNESAPWQVKRGSLWHSPAIEIYGAKRFLFLRSCILGSRSSMPRTASSKPIIVADGGQTLPTHASATTIVHKRQDQPQALQVSKIFSKLMKHFAPQLQRMLGSRVAMETSGPTGHAIRVLGEAALRLNRWPAPQITRCREGRSCRMLARSSSITTAAPAQPSISNPWTNA
jgi:hypothetical protein